MSKHVSVFQMMDLAASIREGGLDGLNRESLLVINDALKDSLAGVEARLQEKRKAEGGRRKLAPLLTEAQLKNILSGAARQAEVATVPTRVVFERGIWRRKTNRKSKIGNRKCQQGGAK